MTVNWIEFVSLSEMTNVPKCNLKETTFSFKFCYQEKNQVQKNRELKINPDVEAKQLFIRSERADVCTGGHEGSVEPMRATALDLGAHISCTAPLETSGAMVRYRMRC